MVRRSVQVCLLSFCRTALSCPAEAGGDAPGRDSNAYGIGMKIQEIRSPAVKGPDAVTVN